MKYNVIFKFIHLFEKQNETKREESKRETERSPILWFSPKWLQWPELGQYEARSLGPHAGLSCGWQGSRTLAVFCGFPRWFSGSWIRSREPGADTACSSLTRCAIALTPPNFGTIFIVGWLSQGDYRNYCFIYLSAMVKHFKSTFAAVVKYPRHYH